MCVNMSMEIKEIVNGGRAEKNIFLFGALQLWKIHAFKVFMKPQCTYSTDVLLLRKTVTDNRIINRVQGKTNL